MAFQDTGYAREAEWEDMPEMSARQDDLRFTVRAIKSGDGEQAIFSLCRALGDATEAAEVVRNEWRRK